MELTWKDLVYKFPDFGPPFVAWIVQRYGPLPDGPIKEEDYERFRAAYESRHNLDVSETERI